MKKEKVKTRGVVKKIICLALVMIMLTSNFITPIKIFAEEQNGSTAESSTALNEESGESVSTSTSNEESEADTSTNTSNEESEKEENTSTQSEEGEEEEAESTNESSTESEKSESTGLTDEGDRNEQRSSEQTKKLVLQVKKVQQAKAQIV